jgi:serine/threonine protein phosphatase 1
MSNPRLFAKLQATRRVWAISAIHGEAARLMQLHRLLADRLERGDRVVYTGNLIGRGAQVCATLDELLLFRRALLSRPRCFVDDVAYLRGAQEEMWQKLLQLQFATDPRGTLDWMVAHGVGATLEAYGGSVADGKREAAAGALALTRWTSALRSAMQSRPGHFQLLGALRRAAYTSDGSLLFVHTGLDPTRPLEAQNDSFWWNSAAFSRIREPYSTFQRVIRGYDPDHPGIVTGTQTATVDGGCGFGGPLLAACFVPSGELVDSLEA